MPDYHFVPFGRRIIYIREMITIRPGFMKFKGYFHEDEKNMPVERLFNNGKDMYWIRIDSKKQYDMDCSGGFYDESVGAEICLFPSYIVELEFTVLAKNPSKEKATMILGDIIEDEKLLD